MNAVFPGSFDPVTTGHMDIIIRGARLFDRLTVGVLNNIKKTYLFSAEQRAGHLRHLARELPNVDVRVFSGLQWDFAKSCGARVILRGVRGAADFEAARAVALASRGLDNAAFAPGADDIETLFLPCAPQHIYVSSGLVREAFAFGADVSGMVDEYILDELNKLNRGGE